MDRGNHDGRIPSMQSTLPRNRTDRFDKVVAIVIFTLQIGISVPCVAFPAQDSRHPTPSTTKSGAPPDIEPPITFREMLNCMCLVPNLGNGYDYDVRLKNGTYKITYEKNLVETGHLSPEATGILNGHQAGVGIFIWNTGGSGTWDSLLLFRRTKGKVKAVGHYTIGYPGNQGSTYEHFRVLGDRVLLDLKSVHLEPVSNFGDFPDPTPHAMPLSQAEITNTKIPVPTKDQLRNEAGDIEMIQLSNGVCKKGELSCRMAQITRVKFQGEPAAFGIATVSYRGGGVPVGIVYRFRRLGGKAYCDAYYTLKNEYNLRTIARLRLDPDQGRDRDDIIALDVVDVSLTPADFRKPYYGPKPKKGK